MEDGFYLYINYDIINNIKYQTIRVPFEISDGKLYEASCDLEDGEDKSILYQCSKPIDINHSGELELLKELDSFNESYCLTGTLDSIKNEFIKLDLNCGQIYQSIYRPLLTEKIIKHQDDLRDDVPETKDYVDIPIIDTQDYSNRLNQLELLLDDIYDVFKVIAPCKENMACFGHKIRNILILACTEIDSIMKSILIKNGIKSQRIFYTTNDYIKLNKPLHLNEYDLSFSRFEDLGDFNPFSNWNIQNPTTSLSWYSDYNEVKHNRDTTFQLANLKNAINSIMGLSIMIISQYGYRNDLWREKVGKFIKVKAEPRWNIREFYIPRREGEKFNPINFPF